MAASSKDDEQYRIPWAEGLLEGKAAPPRDATEIPPEQRHASALIASGAGIHPGTRKQIAAPVTDPVSWHLVKRVEHLMWSALQEDDFITESFGEYLHGLLRIKGVRQKELCGRIHVSQGYLSSILKDERRPSRDTLIQIAFGLGLDIDEACELLERGGACRLREDVRRDSVIAVCLRFGIRKAYCDSVLFEMGERKIGDVGAQ